MGIRIEAVPAREVRHKAQFLRELLEKAHSRQPFKPIEEQIADCESRDAQLWVVAEGNTPIGVAITRKIRRPDATVVEVTTAGGVRGVEWLRQLRALLHHFRRAVGADRLVVYGRKGWGRFFRIPPIGMTAEGVWIFEDFG